MAEGASPRRVRRAYYEYRHTVAFAETNVVGNVYFAHFLAWQGRCRELFLHRFAPDVLDMIANGLSLATTSCGCDFFDEVRAFDEVAVRMTLLERRQNRLLLSFDYVRLSSGTETMVARGRQEIACMRRTAGGMAPTPVPPSLDTALGPFTMATRPDGLDGHG